MDERNKYEIGEYEKGLDRMSKYWHLATFKKSCQYYYISSQEI